MTSPVSASSILSATELEEAISSLPDAALIRLNKVAQRYCLGLIDPDDLLQEAFLCALDGRRNCPRDVDVVRFLAEAIRSLASNHFKSLKRKSELFIISSADDDDQQFDPVSDKPNPEQAFISDQEAAAINSSILALFKDDEIAQIIIEGDMEGMDPNEIYELTGLDKTAFASKRRLIRRRIDKAYPKGWKQ